MKKTILQFFSCSFLLFILGQLSGTQVFAIEESKFVKSLEPGPFLLPSDEDSWTWGMAPIYDENGKVHIFNSVIPNDGIWVKDSKIVHWVADHPEGPFTLLGDVFVSNEAAYHNPQISKVGDSYVLVFLLNRLNDENGSMQEVGIATAKSLDGPWTESPHNPIIPASGMMNGATIVHASNPTFVVTPEGKYRIYYKSMTDQYGKKKYREMSFAESDHIQGPYVNYAHNPVISYAEQELDIEDPYAFYYNGMYYMIVEDRRDVKSMLEGNQRPGDQIKSGGFRPGLIYQSKDGIDWGIPKVAYRTNETYFGHELARSERPHILWKDGEPEYLYLACHDKDPTAGFVLKIEDWDGEPVVQDRYPEFSWDTVPVCFHFGKSSELMTRQEAEFVASKSNFICLEKGHGSGQFGNTEEGIEQEAIQLKKLNPDAKVIFYWNTLLDYPMYEAHDVYTDHPEWWLKTLDGSLDLKNGNLKRYDLSNPQVREWWIDVAVKAVVDGNTDGVFMDAFPQIVHPRNIELWGQEKYDAIQQGLKDLIRETREEIGDDNLILYNGIRSTPGWNMGFDFPDYTDCAMLEHFGQFQSASKEEMLRDILEMEKAGKNGKMVVFKAWPGFNFTERESMHLPLEEKQKIARENIVFPLASFLVGAQENCYFIYSWGYRMHHGCLEWYPELDQPLGKPLGDAQRNGWELEREFEHAHVWVNLETREAKFEAK